MRRLVLLALLLAACATSTGSTRYVMAEDPGSRYHFKYVFDTTTTLWAKRECELRVDPARQLSEELSVQVFRSISVSSAYIKERRDLTWQIMHSMDRDDLTGRVAYGVQIKWAREGQETRYEPMEMFRLPPVKNQAPGEWSEWMQPSDLREGAFGWWEEAHGQPGTNPPPPAHPFSMRCRIFLDEVPGRLP